MSVAAWPISDSVSSKASFSGGAVDRLTQEVGVPVVARVLLDHVPQQPAQRDRLADPGVDERGLERGALGDLARMLDLGIPVRVSLAHLLGIGDRAVPIEIRLRVVSVYPGPPHTLDPVEPGTLDLGHMPDDAEQRQRGRRHGARGQLLRGQVLALPSQRGPVVVEVGEQHGSLVRLERRVDPVAGSVGHSVWSARVSRYARDVSRSASSGSTPAATASRTTESSRGPKPSPATGASVPARCARDTSLAASASAGWPIGTPSTIDALAFSAALSRSQFSFTSAAPSTLTSPKTCGCRCTSLATRSLATSSMEKRSSSGSSSASRAWNSTCKSRSPSSSRSSAMSSVSMASRVS